MATPWETMKQQPNGIALGKQSKLWIMPQNFKNWGRDVLKNRINCSNGISSWVLQTT